MNLKDQVLMVVFILFSCTSFAQEMNAGMDLGGIKNLYRSGRYNDAVEAAKKFLKLSPENAEAKEVLAFSLFQLKDYKGVINLYTDAQAEFLASPSQLKVRIIAQAKEGNYYSAMLSYRNLREDEALKSGWKAFYHYLVFKINKESAFKELKKMNERAPHISYSIIAGDLYALDGNHAKAIEKFEQALKRDYLNNEAMEKLGDSHFRNRQIDKAVAAYQSILKIHPKLTNVKMKMAWAMEKNGNYLDALKALDSDSNEMIMDYRKKLNERIQNFVNSQTARSVATAGENSPIDGKLTLEEKIIPMPPLEIAAEQSPLLVASAPTPAPLNNSVEVVKASEEKNVINDRSFLEFSLGPKAKKYDLTGVGFNARVDYSTGMAVGVKYAFAPGDRSWETNLTLDHSRTSLSNLRGLVPSDVTLIETRVGISGLYKFNAFSIGPALMYERMSATQTIPNPLRGNVDFANVGVKSGYVYSFNDHFTLKSDVSYFSKLVTTSKTTSVGNVGKRNSINAGVKLFYKFSPTFDYFAGAMFANTNTAYNASAARGTTAAKEKEQDVTFPLGINYVF